MATGNRSTLAARLRMIFSLIRRDEVTVIYDGEDAE